MDGWMDGRTHEGTDMHACKHVSVDLPYTRKVCVNSENGASGHAGRGRQAGIRASRHAESRDAFTREPWRMRLQMEHLASEMLLTNQKTRCALP